MSDIKLTPGITPAGKSSTPTVWNILGHTYYEKSNCVTSFSFETFDPPGTFVPPHIHPTQEEFIYVLEGTFDLQLGTARVQAKVGDLVQMPRGVPHAYYNNQAVPARALFWVSPGGRLRALFDKLHDLTDLEEAVRLSRLHDVEFLPPA